MNTITVAQLYDLYKKHPQVTTDTRNIKPGDLFFALKGPTFNGNEFATTALTLGAAFAIVDEPGLPDNPQLLYCSDALTMLQELAGYHRQQLKIPVLAITGSNGKTTTKELVHAVLSMRYNTATTQGNLNNHIGIPLTLLRIPTDAQVAVIEMGANHQREIAGYCKYTQPTHGLITNCGKAHLEGFGGEAGVKKGKGELFDFLKTTNGQVFACSDFDYFQQMVDDRQLNKVEWYGTNPAVAIKAEVKASDPFLQVEIQKGFDETFTINTQLVGNYNVYNVLAAVALGRHFGVDNLQISAAIEAYTPTNSRSQLLQKGSLSIVLDAYNANPSSMKVAIENFANLKADKKVLMLGAMAELGEATATEHAAIVALIKMHKWNAVVLVGAFFKPYADDYTYFETAAEAAQWWKTSGITKAHVLIKGSRSTSMEQVLNEMPI